MVPLPFPASFLPRVGNRTFRYSQSDLLRYDCRGLINTSSHPYSKLRASLRRGIAHSFIEISYSGLYEERTLHGRM